MMYMKVSLLLCLIVLSLLLVPRAAASETIRYACNELPDMEDAPCDPALLTDLPPYGSTSMSNPAAGQYIVGTADDPLAGFSRRPLDHFIIPAGGLFLDPTRDEPHFGVDYSDPDTYLDSQPVYVHPIGPGYVTARASCPMCFVDGDARGRVEWKRPQYNFGFGVFILIETPYNSSLSIYILYAHLNRDFVSLGDYVTPDDILGVTGNTGYTENNHVHMEVRFGPPGRFWNADFTQWATLDRWQATMFADPARLVFPENHLGFIAFIEEWLAQQPQTDHLP